MVDESPDHCNGKLLLQAQQALRKAQSARDMFDDNEVEGSMSFATEAVEHLRDRYYTLFSLVL